MNGPRPVSHLTTEIKKMFSDIQKTANPKKKDQLIQALINKVDSLEASSKAELESTIPKFRAAYNALQEHLSKIDETIDIVTKSGPPTDPDEVDNLMKKLQKESFEEKEREAADRLNQTSLEARWEKLQRDTANFTYAITPAPSSALPPQNDSELDTDLEDNSEFDAELIKVAATLTSSEDIALLEEIKLIHTEEKANQFLEEANDLKQDLHTAHNNAEAERKNILTTQYEGNPAKARQDGNSPSRKKLEAATSTLSFTAKILKELDTLVSTVKNLLNAWFTSHSAKVKTPQPTSSLESPTLSDALSKQDIALTHLRNQLAKFEQEKARLLKEQSQIKSSLNKESRTDPLRPSSGLQKRAESIQRSLNQLDKYIQRERGKIKKIETIKQGLSNTNNKAAPLRPFKR